MALAIDASTPAQATKGVRTGTTIVSAAFTAPANSLLVAFVTYNTVAATADNHTVTDSGGLTWTLVGRKSRDGASSIGGASISSGGAEIWSAVPTTAVSRTVTATQAVGMEAIIAVKVMTDTITPSIGAVTAAGALSSAPSLAVTTTAAASWVWGVNSDWNASPLGTAGAGQTIVDEFTVTGQYTSHLLRQTVTTPVIGTVVTINQTAPATQEWSQLTVEIAGAPQVAPEEAQNALAVNAMFSMAKSGRGF